MQIKIPEFCITALVGVSGSGKSTFAKKHFKSTEVLSSDYFRGLVSDDEADQSVTKSAFRLIYEVAAERLRHKKLTVIDATNVQKDSRTEILRLAKEYHCFATAIVLYVPETLAVERNSKRPDRPFGAGVVSRQMQNLKKTVKTLKDEGFRYIYVLNSVEEIEEAQINREKLWTNLEHESGPFDIIGDVHGCYEELKALLVKLGYSMNEGAANEVTVTPPKGRRAIFVGDLVDRGPASPQVVRLVSQMVKSGQAFCVAGNHDVKLVKYFSGRKVQETHGLKQSIEQFLNVSVEEREQAKNFLDKLISHYVFDQGKLVVSHAGLKEEFQGRSSGAVREFALYGETSGEIDEFGLPVRVNWAKEYRGKALVVYGHTPVTEASYYNNTICLDTGCVFGGNLTAFRYPERELISVEAKKIYYEPIRPIFSAKGDDFDLTLDINDTVGRRRIDTGLKGGITIQSENANAALEVMSRFAIDPRWLIYLPPTMSPPEVANISGVLAGTDTFSSADPRALVNLEFPTDAFDYFQRRGVQKLIMEEKHMGSRAVMVICKDRTVPAKRFRIPEERIGVIYSRSGRAFFDDIKLEEQVLELAQKALTESDFWQRHKTDWVCLDCEIMPWSLKATELLQTQYAAVGAAATPATGKTLASFEMANKRDMEKNQSFYEMLGRLRETAQLVDLYKKSYQQYCWPFTSIKDLKIAPFHILASEGVVNVDKDHLWHMTEIEKICDINNSLFKKTGYKLIDLKDESTVKAAIDWWTEITTNGSEGAVIKSLDFIFREKGKVIQPMIKCRGREYLRIIYGPTYTLKDEMDALFHRNIWLKRRLALDEFSLGIEALTRFVKNEPLWRVHECVFGILALESEPIDPRL